jgi:hypothetical protein
LRAWRSSSWGASCFPPDRSVSSLPHTMSFPPNLCFLRPARDSALPAPRLASRARADLSTRPTAGACGPRGRKWCGLLVSRRRGDRLQGPPGAGPGGLGTGTEAPRAGSCHPQQGRRARKDRGRSRCPVRAPLFANCAHVREQAREANLQPACLPPPPITNHASPSPPYGLAHLLSNQTTLDIVSTTAGRLRPGKRASETRRTPMPRRSGGAMRSWMPSRLT